MSVYLLAVVWEMPPEAMPCRMVPVTPERGDALDYLIPLPGEQPTASLELVAGRPGQTMTAQPESPRAVDGCGGCHVQLGW